MNALEMLLDPKVPAQVSLAMQDEIAHRLKIAGVESMPAMHEAEYVLVLHKTTCKFCGSVNYSAPTEFHGPKWVAKNGAQSKAIKRPTKGATRMEISSHSTVEICHDCWNVAIPGEEVPPVKEKKAGPTLQVMMTAEVGDAELLEYVVGLATWFYVTAPHCGYGAKWIHKIRSTFNIPGLRALLARIRQEMTHAAKSNKKLSDAIKGK